MTETEIIRRWQWSKRDMKQVIVLTQLSQNKITDIIHLLNGYGLMKEGWTKNRKVPGRRVQKRGD